MQCWQLQKVEKGWKYMRAKWTKRSQIEVPTTNGKPEGLESSWLHLPVSKMNSLDAKLW